MSYVEYGSAHGGDGGLVMIMNCRHDDCVTRFSFLVTWCKIVKNLGKLFELMMGNKCIQPIKSSILVWYLLYFLDIIVLARLDNQFVPDC